MSAYQHILVTTDFSDASLPGVAEAARLAKDLGSKVTLLYVVQDVLPPIIGGNAMRAEEILEQHGQEARKHLRALADTHFDGEVECDVRTGRPSVAILRAAEEGAADLMVIASHGYGVAAKLLFGSTTERVLRGAHCPVLVVPSHPEEKG